MSVVDGRAGVVFQCAACRALAVASSISLDGGRAGLACAACGNVTWLPIAQTTGSTVVVDADTARSSMAPVALPSPAPTSPAPPSTALPSMALATVAGTGMVVVGLAPDVRARVRSRVGALPAGGAEQQPLAQSFDALLDDWHNAAAHKQLLKKAAMTDQLAFVGQRFRAVLDESPGEAAAKKAQNEIMTLAMAALGNKKDLGSLEEKGNGKTALAVIAVVALVLVLVAALWVVPKLLPMAGAGATMGEPQNP